MIPLYSQITLAAGNKPRVKDMTHGQTIEQTSTHLSQKIKFFLSRNFRFIPPFLGLLVFLFGAIFFLSVRLADIKAMISQKRQEQEQALTIYVGYLSKLGKLKESYAAVRQSELDKLSLFLPAAPEVEKSMVELENIVGRNGLALSYIKASEPAEKSDTVARGGIKKVLIDLSVSGVDYQRLKIFLAELENNLRLTDIQKINYSPASATVTLSLLTYYLSVH